MVLSHFPTAYFLHVGYSESLFLARRWLYLAARVERWWLLGCWVFLLYDRAAGRFDLPSLYAAQQYCASQAGIGVGFDYGRNGWLRGIFAINWHVIFLPTNAKSIIRTVIRLAFSGNSQFVNSITLPQMKHKW
jgi:hypothetical protein